MRSRIALSFLAGASAGLLGGLFGVGGGIILVPMLVIFLHLKQYEAHGTSLLIIVPIAISGGIIYALQGYINWVLALELALGSVVGVIIGARLMVKVPARALRLGFGVLLLLLGLRLVIWGSAKL